MSHNPSKRTGFTLVELLVVIGIIALLIGILMPALGKAREQANMAACLSNMRQIGMACVQYTQDNHGTMVPCGVYKNVHGDSTCKDWWETVLVTANYLHKQSPAPAAVADASTQSVANGVFFCPTNYTGTFHRVQSTLFDKTLFVDSSYIMNGCDQQYGPAASAFGFTPPADGGGWAPAYIFFGRELGFYAPKITNVRHSSACVLLFEGVSTPTTEAFNVRSTPTRWLAPHQKGKRTDLLFCDGHAEGVAYKLDPASGKPLPIFPGSEGAGILWYANR